MPAVSLSKLATTKVSLPRRRPRRASGSGLVTGLDIEPGEVVAAQVRVNGHAVVERAVAGEITHGMMRDGEVSDPDALGSWLKAFFAEHGLAPRVRVGLASPRAVGRILDLPPLQDPRDLAAAVRMQAADHIAMPLAEAVLDHRSLGIVDTPDGPRSRVVVAAAQRRPVEQLLAALRKANLRPEGIDLSAFALVRALRAAAADAGDEPVLYVNVGGVTTLAIASGTTCELTRVSPVDLETLAERLAEREGIPMGDARRRIVGFGRDGETDEKALEVLDGGLAELADDLSKTMEFHANQAGGRPVAEVLLSGPAALIPNFPEVLGQRMGTTVRRAAPDEAQEGGLAALGAERASIAAGLAVEEAPA